MRQALLKAALRSLFRPVAGPPWPFAFQRAWIGALSRVNRSAGGLRRETVTLDGIRCERLTPPDADGERCVVYLHGGAYVLGSPASCRPITSHIAALGGATVIVPRYRLAPEHPFPAGRDDALTVLQAALRDYPRVMLAGDSAGGGLALAVAQQQRDRGGVMPERLMLISPWVDLDPDAPGRHERAARDPMLRPEWMRQCASAYVGDGEDPRDPDWSPLYAGMAGLPETLIQVGSEELLYEDATRLHAALRNAEVSCTLREYPGLWHDFQLHAALLPVARQAIGTICAFFAPAQPGKSTTTR